MFSLVNKRLSLPLGLPGMVKPMALARCGIVGVTRASVICGRNIRSSTARTGTGKHRRIRVRVG